MKRIMHNAWQTAVLSALLLTVTAGYAQTKHYPYVQDGKIIVCREGTDGVKSSLIHPNWTTTPSHNELDATNNRFAAKFEVLNGRSLSGQWSGACASNYEGKTGWRLPTIRELQLILALRNELTSISFHISSYLWSATKDSSSDGSVWSINTYTGANISRGSSTSDIGYSYCVRDL